MNDSTNGHDVLCPLCEGKGKMHRSELAARLANHDVEARLTACRQELVTPDMSGQEATPEAPTFHEKVVKGPVTRILWRRSLKE
jgi:hypothetical protein